MTQRAAYILCVALLATTKMSCSYDLESLRAGREGEDGGGGRPQMTTDVGAPSNTEDAAGGQAGQIMAGGMGGAAGSLMGGAAGSPMGGAGGALMGGAAGSSMGGAAGSLMGGAGGTPVCSPMPEACNNRDDDCDGVTDNGAPCPPSAIRNGWIYFFGTQLMSWHHARAWCQSLGHDAVVLNDQAEHTWFAEESSLQSRTCRWLGLNDEAAEGQWVWVNGTPAEFSFWGPEQPNNAGPNGEHCAALIPLAYLNRPSTWSDIVCDGTEALTQCLAACRGRSP